MGVYQNYPIKEIRTNKCPRCGNPKVPNGTFFVTSVDIPLKVKAFIFRINVNVKVKLKYCPHCGYLRVELLHI